jgi:2,3-diketo-5-methylthio-1-phosphopentane phosphatase
MEKTLLLFDFDKTIIKNDVIHTLTLHFIPELYHKMNGFLYKVNPWIPFNNEIFKEMKKNNVTIEKLKEQMGKFELSPNFNELFTFIKNNKEKFDVNILSAGNKYCISNILEQKNLLSIFNNIYADDGEENEENLVKVSSIGFLNCNYCNPALCKSLVFDKYFKEKYKKVIFICDGYNDFCLSKKLTQKDLILVKKDHSLYNILYEKNGLKDIKCRINIWTNGLEIINVLEKELKYSV